MAIATTYLVVQDVCNQYSKKLATNIITILNNQIYARSNISVGITTFKVLLWCAYFDKK